MSNGLQVAADIFQCVSLKDISRCEMLLEGLRGPTCCLAAQKLKHIGNGHQDARQEPNDTAPVMILHKHIFSLEVLW